MPIILVVEGLTDATFFMELFIRLYLHQASVNYVDRRGRSNIPRGVTGVGSDGSVLEVEFRNQEGKTSIPESINALLGTRVNVFTVAQDIDRSTGDEAFESIRRLLQAQQAQQWTVSGSQSLSLVHGGGAIKVLPMGLDDDATLVALGIKKHELEDYLIKLMFEDAHLRENAPELQELISQILPTIRCHDGPFDSSKEVFQLIKPLVQHGFSDTGVLQKLIRDADPNILRAVVGPLLTDVEQAFGVVPLS